MQLYCMKLTARMFKALADETRLRILGLWVYYKVTAEGCAFQQEIANLLLKHLPEFSGAAEDRERLASFTDSKKCV